MPTGRRQKRVRKSRNADARAQTSGARASEPTTPGAQTTPREPTVPGIRPHLSVLVRRPARLAIALLDILFRDGKQGDPPLTVRFGRGRTLMVVQPEDAADGHAELGQMPGK